MRISDYSNIKLIGSRMHLLIKNKDQNGDIPRTLKCSRSVENVGSCSQILQTSISPFQDNPFLLLFFFGAFFMNAIAYVIMSYCSVVVIRTMRQRDKISNRTVRMQHQMNLMLIVQVGGDFLCSPFLD